MSIGMAFHVACPITSRKLCFCELGFPGRIQGWKGKNDFLQEVGLVERFLNDPWLVKCGESNVTVKVKVPKVVVAQGPAPPPAKGAGIGGIGGEESVKRAVLQNQAATAPVVAANNARRVESGDDLALASAKDDAEDEQNMSNAKVMCQLCFSGENEGSVNARKMLPCCSCGKKYHRNCLKSWSKNRDIFHWSQWTCPSCRTCEVCRKTGDASKFMFCKRCDEAYHCYCQHPPHKNVGNGPYLCPKHAKCHSCGSSVPGNGLSLRWFLGYTCCDSCGRLFMKGNYCPVCLKVYRDSESTPMVCCDICQCWVHLPCDGISDAKYMQFQVNRNLQYVCPTCRGECSKIKSLEEAVQELWRRRDEADRDVIVSLRAAAGLPTHGEVFDISSFSDDDERGPIVTNEYSHSLKFSLKGLGDSSGENGKEHAKQSSYNKHGKKRGSETALIIDNEAHQSSITEQFGSPSIGNSACNEMGLTKHKCVEEVTPINVPKMDRTIKIKSNKPHSLTDKEETGTNSGVPKGTQGPKLVIHFGGGRNRSATSPSRSDASNHKEPEVPVNTKRSISGSASIGLHEDASRAHSIAQTSSTHRKTFLRFEIPRNSSDANQQNNVSSKSNDGGNQSSVSLPGKEEVTYTTGQRSKRKRPSSLVHEE